MGERAETPVSAAPAPPGRAIAVDLGERRIGVAVSDSRRVLAQPNTVIVRSGEVAVDHRAIAAIVEEYQATVVVVGLPISLSGRIGAAGSRAVAEAEALRSVLGIPVLLYDERLSTVEAERRRREADTRGSRSPTTKRRAVVDDLAAAVILQSWIDAGVGGVECGSRVQ